MPTQKTNRKDINIEIRLSGDGFPTHAEMDLRWVLEDQIVERGIAESADGGAGGGRMDIAFIVANSEAVDSAIEKVKKLLEEYDMSERAKITVSDVYESICNETPDFQSGDCLSFRFNDGDYGAILVLAHGNAGLHIEEVLTLIGVLDYKDSKLPDMNIFKERRWLIETNKWRIGQPYLVWLDCYGDTEFSVVGKVILRGDDPTECKFHLSWDNVPEYFVREKTRNASAQN